MHHCQVKSRVIYYILLMVQKSSDHQLSLVVYPIINPGFMDKNPAPVEVGGVFPIIYKVLYTSQRWWLAGFLNHQHPSL